MVEGEQGRATKRSVRGFATWSGSLGLLIGASVSTPAVAADQTWACQVAICASNPGGWMQFAECVPPIRKLITSLAMGGSFPTCTSGGFDSAKYTKPKHGNPGTVVFTMSNGTKQAYTVPSQNDVYVAQAATAGQTTSQ